MSKYIGSEEKFVKAGEKLNFKNLSKSPVTVGTAAMFNKDGVYICDVLNGRVRITYGEQAKVKHGNWIECCPLNEFNVMLDENIYFMCSECKAKVKQKYNFCPNCGADMRGKENEN